MSADSTLNVGDTPALPDSKDDDPNMPREPLCEEDEAKILQIMQSHQMIDLPMALCNMTLAVSRS